MHLEPASSRIPPGLPDLLRELGDGEAGFGGTSFGTGNATLTKCLQDFRDGEDPANLQPGLVPQTTCWLIDDAGHAVGMVRIRHCLNERTTHNGGHVGYYVRPSERRKGYATAALRLAVAHLRGIGVNRVLVTCDPANDASNRVILTNGGVPDEPGRHPDTGQPVNRYWIIAGDIP